MFKINLSNQTLPILCNLLAAMLGAFGQYFYKIGSSKINIIPLSRNFYLYSGVALFCLVMVLFIIGFRLGGRISIVYPVYATTFIWGVLIAIFILKEPWNLTQILGVGVIVAGVTAIAIGGPEL